MGQLLEALKGINLPSSAQKVVNDADVIYSKRRDDAAYVAHLEAKIKELESELSDLHKQKGTSGVAHGLAFDQRTGTYTESSSNLRYCAKCISDNKRSPLRDTGHGWHCMVCGSRPPDPSRPYGSIVANTDYDPFK